MTKGRDGLGKALGLRTRHAVIRNEVVDVAPVGRKTSDQDEEDRVLGSIVATATVFHKVPGDGAQARDIYRGPLLQGRAFSS